jgi:hypothetical protein
MRARLAFGFAGSLVAAGVILAGCSAVERGIDGDPVQGVSQDAGGALVDLAGAACGAQALTPPALLLSTSLGDQTGAPDGYCSSSKSGCGVCVDIAMLPAPEHFNLVHSDDQVTLSMPDGTLTMPGPDRCQPACPPQVEIRSLCSNRLVSTQTFTEDQAWTIDLAPGAYLLDVSTHFRVGDLDGSTGAVFGLIVDDSHERAIVDEYASGTICDYADGGT